MALKNKPVFYIGKFQPIIVFMGKCPSGLRPYWNNWRYGTQHNDIQLNKTQLKSPTRDTHHKWHLAKTTLSIITLFHYAECRFAECRILFILMLNVVMLSFIMLSVMAPKISLVRKKVLETNTLAYLLLASSVQEKSVITSTSGKMLLLLSIHSCAQENLNF